VGDRVFGEAVLGCFEVGFSVFFVVLRKAFSLIS
jgi:hypothetical protein